MENETNKSLSFLRSALPAWFNKNARRLPWREDREPYHVWLSEIMLQQTRVEAVTGYYRRFISALPDIPALAAADEDLLLKLWEGLGYYNRARNLQKAAKVICSDHNGEFPAEYSRILALPGVGPYTAGAVASICFDLPTPAVDGNVLRVMTRYLEDPSVIDAEATKKKISALLAPIYQNGNCGVITQALMELGACVCIPNGEPKCPACPIREHCLAYRHNSWENYPVRAKKNPRKRIRKIVLILNCKDNYAIRKRDGSGLLANLWEFPNADANETADTLQTAVHFAQELGVRPKEIVKEIRYTHVFTHVEWEMTAVYISCVEMPETLQWATKKQLETYYALPSAFKPFFEAIPERQK